MEEIVTPRHAAVRADEPRLGVVASGTVQGVVSGVAVGLVVAGAFGLFGGSDALGFAFVAAVVAVPAGALAGALAGVAVGTIAKLFRNRLGRRALRTAAAVACLVACGLVSLGLFAWMGPFALLTLPVVLPAAAAIAAWRAPDIADPRRS